MRYNKYKNKKTTRTINNEVYKFDSLKEARRFDQLLLLAKQGKITELTLQPTFLLLDKFTDKDLTKHRAIKYIADFKYIQDGKTIVEDVKSSKNFTTDVYKLKKKLFLFKYGNELDFKEIF